MLAYEMSHVWDEEEQKCVDIGLVSISDRHDHQATMVTMIKTCAKADAQGNHLFPYIFYLKDPESFRDILSLNQCFNHVGLVHVDELEADHNVIPLTFYVTGSMNQCLAKGQTDADYEELGQRGRYEANYIPYRITDDERKQGELEFDLPSWLDGIRKGMRKPDYVYTNVSVKEMNYLFENIEVENLLGNGAIDMKCVEILKRLDFEDVDQNRARLEGEIEKVEKKKKKKRKKSKKIDKREKESEVKVIESENEIEIDDESLIVDCRGK